MPDNLPALPDDASVEPEYIFDGEVVDEPETQPAVRSAVTVVQVITVVVQHPVPRTAVRHAGYVTAGVVVAWRRWRHARMRPERMMQQAEMQGDHAQVIAWRQQLEAEKQNRHGRIVKSAETVVTVARNSLVITGAAFGAGLVLSILLSVKWGLRGFEWPWEVAAAAAVAAVSVAGVIWLTALVAVPLGVLGLLHEIGRRGGDLAPGWLTAGKAPEEERGLVVTADTIVLALQNTPVAALKKAFKDGWVPSFRLTPIRDGEGYSAVFSTPLGVTANDIADQIDVFARNLHRAKAEVWVTDAERAKIAPAGHVSLWVANPGVLDRPTPEYPLMHDGQADVFEGVPGGVVARGDGALIPVTGKNVVVGGQMGEGKSNTCRVYLLGCCTDPLCEADAFVFANNGDFDAFAPRLANYFKGTEDDTVLAAVNRLQELYEEVGHREGRLAELGAKKLTRRIAEHHPDMRPVVSLYSECHELFGHPEYGELAGELATKIAKRARKTGIVLVFDTQSSRKEAIPPKLVELMSVNVCFYVKRWQSNDGFLGDGSFQAGIRATELRPGRDRGRSVVTGISDAQFELLKWYFVEVDDDTGYDAAAEVIARCMRNLAPGTRVSGADGAGLPVIEVRDLLDDLDAVIDGPDRVRLADLPARLRKIAPSWLPYRGLTGKELKALLEDDGVRTLTTGGILQMDPADLCKAIAAREGE